MSQDGNIEDYTETGKEPPTWEIVDHVVSPTSKEILDVMTPENKDGQVQDLYEHKPDDTLLIDSLLAVGASNGQTEEKFCTECYSHMEFEVGEYDECPYCNTSFS